MPAGHFSEVLIIHIISCLTLSLCAFPNGAERERILREVGDAGLANESAVLTDVKRALNVTKELERSWTGGVCQGNKSDWIGINCTAGKVVSIELTFENVRGGFLAPALASLRSLTSVSLSKCNLTGTLPSAWASLTDLTSIDLSYNSLQGSLPDAWGGLSRLNTLDLGWNLLSGTLPTSFEKLSSIQYLYLNDNRLGGTLPASWASIGRSLVDSTVEVALSRNQLSGSLPPEWSSWTTLGRLYINSNPLTGSLPASWQALSQLRELSLFGNRLSGTLPPQWSNLTSLDYLDVSNNFLTGTLPGVWASIPSLATMHIYNNTLEGPLPRSWGGMPAIVEINLTHNNLTGTLPDQWGRLSSLRHLSLAFNNISGTLPGDSWADGMFSLKTLHLQSNRISGTLPEIWFTSPNAWTHIERIDLRWNHLWGPVPTPGETASFTFNRQRNPRLFLEPMGTGPGMCGAIPKNGPTIHSTNELLLRDFTPIPPPLQSFSVSCPGQGFPAVVKVAGAVLGCLGAAVGASAVACLLWRTVQKKRRTAGTIVPPDFFAGSMRSMVSWRGASSGSQRSNIMLSTATSKTGLLRRLTDSPFGLPETGAPDFIRSPFALADSPGFAMDGLRGSPFALPESPGTGFKGITPRRSSSDKSRRGSDLSRKSRSSLRSQSLCVDDLEFATDEKGKRDVIGAGAYGKVYRGVWKGTKVAVKVVRDESYLEVTVTESGKSQLVAPSREAQREDLRKEADLLEQLRHPNVVNFLGLCMEGDTIMVVTELCEGGDLYKAMQRSRHSRAFSWYMRGSKVALDVACGLAYLHSKGVIHYDIKPGNILLDSSGESAKISDVGMSKTLATLTGTASNTVRGTLDYMAPELLMGERSSYAVDIYSFGIMLGEIITGESPDRRRGCVRDPRVPEDCCEAAAALYMRCIDPLPECRPSSKEVAEELRRIQPNLGLQHPEAIL
eukprot:jgi/Botrbrau1/13471/Bobra.0082s0070.1